MITKAEYMQAHSKSRLTSFFLTLLLGPIGLLYASGKWGAAMIALAILSAPTYIGPAIVWIASICIGDHIAYKENIRIGMDYDLRYDNE